jgi:hypothetical protein
LGQAAGLLSIVHRNALQDGAFGLKRGGKVDGGIEARLGGDDVGQGAEFLGQRAPVFDAVAGLFLEDGHVGGGAEQAPLQRVPEAVVDGEGDDERHDAGGHAGHGDEGDDGEDGLLSLGLEIAERDEEFEAFPQPRFRRHRVL